MPGGGRFTSRLRRVTTTPRDTYLSVLQSVIAGHGWAVQGVLPDADDPDAAFKPSLFYTVGLTEKQLPELVTLGLNAGYAHTMLNMIAQEVLGAPALAVGGGHVELSLPGGTIRVTLAAAPGAVRMLHTAIALYGLDRLRPPLQVAWAF